MTEFSDFLSNYAEKSEKPLVFVIDELDRCRPDFALELIEQVKHLFSVPKLTFLLVLNREQLEETIKACYGNGIRASSYLQKFVNIWLSLPRKFDNTQYSDIDDGARFVQHAFNEMLTENDKFNNTDALDVLCELVKQLKPTFREIEQVLAYFALLQNVGKNGNQYYSSYQAIYAFICYVKVTNPYLLKKVEKFALSAESIIKAVGLEDVSENGHLEYLVKFIKFDLADTETKQLMLAEKEINRQDYGRLGHNVIKNVCSWLSNVQIN
jgi:translation elongation factor EF-G